MSAVLPAEILAANQRAMKMLRDGEMEASHRLLADTLAQAEAMVKSVPAPAASRERGSRAPQPVAQQEVLLAYAVTLNNFGCQLRRQDQLEAALDKIQKASEVEHALFGKPACSTMLNLSSVLVGMGKAEEALPIAKSCVLAAQGGEPTLLITALHNLAVALGQQPGKKERQLALTTMLRALRDSEEKLGSHHPTTVMLREKCGMRPQEVERDEEGKRAGNRPPSGSVPPSAEQCSKIYADRSPRSDVDHAGRLTSLTHGAPSFLAPQPTGPRAAPSASARERGRRALATLNFGTPHSTPLQAPIDVPSATLQAPVKASQTHAASASVDSLSSTARPHARAPPRDLPPLPEVPLVTGGVGPIGAATSGASDADVHRTVRGSSSSSETRLGIPRHTAAEVLPCTAVSVQQCPSMLMGQSGLTSSSLPSLSFEKRVSDTSLGASGSERGLAATTAASPRTPSQHPPSQSTQAAAAKQHALVHSAARTPYAALGSVGITDTHGERVPRYMRFAPDVTHVSRQSLATPNTAAAPAPAQKSQTVGTSEASVPAQTASTWRTPIRPSPALSQTAPAMSAQARETEMEVHRSVFRSDPAARRVRETLRQHAQVEEDAFRRLRQRRAAEREAEARFQDKLRLIEARRDARAAVAIQKAWRQWWHLIGRARSEAQKRQLEERRRRRAERLAMEARRGHSGAGTAGGAASGRRSHHHVSGLGGEAERPALLHRAFPAAVVVCAEAWLKNTECRRYLVRHGYAPLPRYVRERQVAHAVVRFQAHFRGRQVRRALAADSGKGGPVRVPLAVDPSEEREYAAMVIQRAFRGFSARRLRQALHVSRYEQRTRKIQAWFRATLRDQRRRGVDTQSLRHRTEAAVRIQAAWRGYNARVAFLMLRLKSRMEKTRLQQHGARMCLQRVSRGFVARRLLGQAFTACQRVSDSQMEAPALCTAAEPAAHPRWPELVIPRNAYEADCLSRASALARQREEERERYDITLYAEPQAQRERQAWVEALRLRPTQVALRRADEDLRTELEAHTLLRDRAATKIQRLFRTWWRHMHSDRRDRDLLLRSRGLYQQKELEIKFQRQQRAKLKARGVALAGGDCTVPVRTYREALRQELDALEAIQPVAVEAVRTQPERHYDEHVIQRDESILRVTFPADMARLRENMQDRKAATGKVYEHPYFKPYPNDEFRMTLGID